MEEQFYALWRFALAAAVGGVGRWWWGSTARMSRAPSRALPAVACALLIAPVARYLEYRHHGWRDTWPVPSHFEMVLDALATGVLLAYVSDSLAPSPATAWYRRIQGTPLPLVPAVYGAHAIGLIAHPKVDVAVGDPEANVGIALLTDWTVRRPTTILVHGLNLAPLR